MENQKIVDYILEQTKAVLAIDSPSGYTKDAVAYVCNAYRELGYHPEITVKGGVLVDLGPADGQDAILIEAHLDTLGAMVAEVKANGRLKLSPLGGMTPNNAEAENCHVITRSGKRYEGTFQLANASQGNKYVDIYNANIPSTKDISAKYFNAFFSFIGYASFVCFIVYSFFVVFYYTLKQLKCQCDLNNFTRKHANS